jgi:hypothetical protein
VGGSGIRGPRRVVVFMLNICRGAQDQCLPRYLGEEQTAVRFPGAMSWAQLSAPETLLVSGRT